MESANGESGEAVLLPCPQRLVLRNFSLYSRRRTLEVDFDREVFCLAGANGLGKSTFLASLNYGMTGVVAKPGQNFLGAGDYYEDLIKYSAAYFDGRINAEDHDVAEVELTTRVGESEIRLVRGMFEPQGLRDLSIKGPGGTETFSDPEVSNAARHERYVEAICAAAHLSDFAQLVFLQLVVLTFDEQRRLMFWTPRATEQALFLAFGVSSDTASRAEALQRSWDSADSRARNLQWQATRSRRRLEALNETVGSDEEAAAPDLQAEHEALDKSLDEAGVRLKDAEAAQVEAEVELDDAAAKLLAAKSDYEQFYNQRLDASRSAHLHPIVVGSISDETCGVCGTQGTAVVAAIEGALGKDLCPLCEAQLPAVDQAELDQVREKLERAGDEIVAFEKVQQVALEQLRRRRLQSAESDQELRDISRRLEGFRRENSKALLRASGESGLLQDAAGSIQEEISDLLEQKESELGRREIAQAGLNKLRDGLAARFAQMEHEFVPLLHDLANEFLGVPLEVDLERRGASIGLVLSFRGSERRSPEDLSESQRFFIDIALRMALAKKLSTTDQPATLYVDTPEGSLDIAYEKRAGRMFGLFARGGGAPNRLVLTANINTSQLLQQLASYCGEDHMELVRMTDWTTLSDVQMEAESDFEQAYATIEARLAGEDP